MKLESNFFNGLFQLKFPDPALKVKPMEKELEVKPLDDTTKLTEDTTQLMEVSPINGVNDGSSTVVLINNSDNGNNGNKMQHKD